MKIFLTSAPGIKKISSCLNIRLCGFYTQEVRERGKRLGFDIVRLPDNRVTELSRVGFFVDKSIWKIRSEYEKYG